MDAAILYPVRDFSPDSLPFKTFDEKSKETFEFYAGYKKNIFSPIYDPKTDHLGVVDYGLFFTPTFFLYAAYGIFQGVKAIFSNEDTSNTMKIVFGCTVSLPAVAVMAACFSAFLALTAMKYVMAGVLTFLSLPVVGIVHAYHKPDGSKYTKVPCAPPVPQRPHQAANNVRSAPATNSSQSASTPSVTSDSQTDNPSATEANRSGFTQTVRDARRALGEQGGLASIGESMESLAAKAKERKEELHQLAQAAEKGGKFLGNVLSALSRE